MKVLTANIKMILDKISRVSLKAKIISAVTGAAVLAIVIFGVTMLLHSDVIAKFPSLWPDSFAADDYIEPEFIDEPDRENNAFNVADFGEQGKNGWFYRYGKASKPTKSRRMETYNEGGYRQMGVNGLEIKKDFVHTGEEAAPILEWRAAKKGSVNLSLTYVKNVNGDKNPSWPDGVCIYIYKGEKLLESHQVDAETDKEIILETSINKLPVEEKESIYIAVDPKSNNAFDGGLLYAAITDVNKKPVTAKEDKSRIDNNANNIKDYGEQGKNGWCYMYGKDAAHSKLTSTETEDGYINYTSPGLVIKKDYIHPAINDSAILSWTPKTDGIIEVRGKYTKFAQNDGNPDWPDGTTVQVYLNNQKLFEQAVKAPGKGETKIDFREAAVNVTTSDKLYFIVKANKNSSYDGGCLDVSILDRNGRTTEDAIAVDESETRQNFASVKDDFGAQGENGWFYQESYKDEPFGAYNIEQYVENDKYADDNYLEIKRDYVNTGEQGRSAVIKWRVAQSGEIQVDASYTKSKNEDKNPAWPDGTRVTVYHNNTALVSQDFAADVSKEVTKSLDVESVSVNRGDYITMVINGKDNNAYDGGKYTFSIRSLSGLAGTTEKDVAIENDANRTNNANIRTDFGPQGKNGWFYQYGYYTDPYFAVNIEQYQSDEKYTTRDGIEIKRDFIMPSTKGKSANVKWIAAQNGRIHIFADYTKLKNEDSNPFWPDGTTVTLLHNSKVLKSEYFGANVAEEITKDLSVSDLKVKKGDSITLIVNGLDNTAYDGGLYSFEIEDADTLQLKKKNDSKENRANLAADFGEQGSNGWYYLEGRSLKLSGALTKKTEDDTGYISVSDSDLQVKKDFVQPGLSRDAMYQWVAAQNGEVDVTGAYIKFGHNDSNPSWPDGTKVKIYLNNTLLMEKKAAVSQGENNNNTVLIKLGKQKVKKGDIFTFAIDSLENSAWDGGKLAIQIKPGEDDITFNPAPDNDANLFDDFGNQGNEGWYYGYGNSSKAFEPAEMNSGEYSHVWHDGLLLKKDGVQPGADAGAIYRWLAGADGKINLEGAYYKARNESADDDTPDGVKVEVYKNGKLIDGMSYDIPVSRTEETACQMEAYNLEVKKGDKLDFIITAKDNAAWDYGKLEMDITAVRKPDFSSVAGGRKNRTNLYEQFGEQGSDGWFYLEGRSLAGANMLTAKTDDNAGYQSAKDSDLQVKRDFVQPGAAKDAMYQWGVAEDGEIDIIGSYIKFGQNDSNPSWPDGTRLKVYLNDALLFEQDAEVYQGDGNNNVIAVNLEKLTVAKEDILTFAVNAKGNSAWDGGSLAIQVKPYEPEPEYVPAPDNEASLFDDFGEQGSQGWYYGYGNHGNEFKTADYQGEEYKSALYSDLLLKKDGVHPGDGAGAIYRWIAGSDGEINLQGTYYKSRNENQEDNAPDGVKVEVCKNGEIIEGMSYDVPVSKEQENVQQIATSGLEVTRGDILDFIITSKENASWDYGKLEMKISTETDLQDPVEPPEPVDPPGPVEPEERTNNTDLFQSFGTQGNDGWYYGACDWDGKNFWELPYDEANDRYCNTGENIKPELKRDYVEPGNGNAAYKWVAAQSGKIQITGNYVKFPNDSDANADGVTLRIFQNQAEKKWIGGDPIQTGGISSEVTVAIDQILDVAQGDEIIFAVNPEGNDFYDGGRLTITITSID